MRERRNPKRRLERTHHTAIGLGDRPLFSNPGAKDQILVLVVEREDFTPSAPCQNGAEGGHTSRHGFVKRLPGPPATHLGTSCHELRRAPNSWWSVQRDTPATTGHAILAVP